MGVTLEPSPLLEMRRRQWPAWRPGRVLYEDEDILVVDKPEGVSCQAADPDRPDDLVARLREFLETRGDDSYLGVHQRLDKSTSGVILYSRRRSANRSLAEQFEGRSATKTYLALVDTWGLSSPVTLDHHLRKDREGRQQVVAKGRGAVRARSQVRRLEEQPRGTLLEVRLVTGRTHQIRAQLAEVGSPVIGDPLYGGSMAPRLMLHSHSLSVRHPVTEKKIEIRADAPGEFYGKVPSVQEMLRRAAERRWGLARSVARPDCTTAFRLFNRAADGLDELAIDVYDQWAVAHWYGNPEDPRWSEALTALETWQFAGLYTKLRPRNAHRIDTTAIESIAPAEPAGAAAPTPLIVHEYGVPFRTALGSGLGTGIFLDQRENRRRLRELCAELRPRVLNLFAYTGAFTVACGVGGAKTTLTVDVSERALAEASENLRLNGLDERHHCLRRADVFETIESLLTDSSARFDLVCIDPPTYSTTKRRRWTSGSAWKDLIASCLSLLTPKGRLFLSSNDRRMPRSQLRRYVHRAAQQSRRELIQLKDMPAGLDFAVPAAERSHLSALLATVR